MLKMWSSIIGVAVALTLFAVPAVAKQTIETDRHGNKVVCQTYKPASSNLKKKICEPLPETASSQAEQVKPDTQTQVADTKPADDSLAIAKIIEDAKVDVSVTADAPKPEVTQTQVTQTTTSPSPSPAVVAEKTEVAAKSNPEDKKALRTTEIVLKDGERLRVKRTKGGEDMICEIRRPTGTYLRKANCVPESEYARQELVAKDYLHDVFENGFQRR